jgi:tetratricopeptide (TPR) repeat protein
MVLLPILLLSVVGGCDETVKTALAALQQNNPAQALTLLNPLRAQCTRSSAFYEVLGLANELLDNKTAAEEALHMAVKLDATSSRLWTELGATLLKNGKPAEASKPLDKALKLDPSNPVTLKYNIGAAVGVRNWPRAAELFGKLNIENENRLLEQEPILILWLAQTLLETKQNDRLETLLAAHRNSMPTGLLFSLGTLFAQHAMYKQALEYFKLVPAEAADDALYFNIGLCYSHLQQFDDARRNYFAAIEKHPDHVNAYFHVGLDYVSNGDPRRGVPWLYKAQSLAPGRPDIAYALAGQLIALEYFNSAKEVLARASESAPRDPLLRAAEGDLKRAQGDTAGAAASYQKALTQKPGLPAALVGLGKIDLETGKETEGRRLLNAVLAHDPQDPVANGEIGLFEARTGNWDAALNHLGRTWEHDHSNPAIALELARAYEKKARPEDALRLLQSIAPEMEDSAAFHFQLMQIYTLLHRPADAQLQRNAFNELQASSENVLRFDNPHTYVH